MYQFFFRKAIESVFRVDSILLTYHCISIRLEDIEHDETSKNNKYYYGDAAN